MFFKILLLTLLLLPLQSFANNGTVKVVKGNVFVISGKTKLKTTIKLGQKIYSTDTIETLKDSRIKIIMIDGNELNISPNSKIIISKYEFDNGGKKKNVLLNVLKGKVRSKVKQKYDGDNNKFQVKTKTAVAGVRGTDFLASYQPENNSSNIITFEGKVEFGIAGSNGKIVKPVYVTAGQTVSQIGSKLPTTPTAVPAIELAEIDTQTDAEKAPANSPLQEKQIPQKDKEKDSKEKNSLNKENQKNESNTKQATNKNQQSTNNSRQPAATSPSDSTMIIESDLPSTDNNDFMDSFPSGDSLLTIGNAGLIKDYERIPTCEFCNDVINTNDAYLKIKVKK